LRPKEARNRPETSENDAAGLFQRIVFSLEPGQSRLVAAFDQTVQGCDLLRSESQAGDDFGRQPGWFCKGQNENSKRDKRDETIVK